MHAADSRLRLLRLAPAALAVYELRYLLAAALHALSSVRVASLNLSSPSSLTLVIVFALGAVLLREMSRGLRTSLARPRWSAGFVLTWLTCCAALLALLAAGQLFAATAHPTATGLAHSPAPLLGAHGIVVSLPGLLVFSLLLTASLQAVRWALCRAHPAPAARGDRARLGRGDPLREAPFSPPPAPLLAGWSDRGPPAARVITAA